MASLAAAGRATDLTVPSTDYERFASHCAMAAGVLGFVYAVAFVVLKNNLLSALMLLLIGVLTTAVVVALYGRLKDTDASFALWGLLLGLAGGLGMAIHGGFDLSNALHPPTTGFPDIPNSVDPRGLLTFGVAGLGLWVVSWLMIRGGQFPKNLGYLGYVAAVLLLLLYLARLIVLDASSMLVVVPALLSGFIVTPIFYVWLGLSLGRTNR